MADKYDAILDEMMGSAPSGDKYDAMLDEMAPGKLTPEQMDAFNKKWKKSMARQDSPILAKAADALAGMTSIPRGVLKMLSPELANKVFPMEGVDKESGTYLAGQIADPYAYAVGAGGAKIAQVPALLASRPIARGMIGGALGGAGVGALNEDSDAATGGMLGGVIGGGIPALGGAGRWLSNRAHGVVDLIRPGGAKSIANRYLDTIAGTNAGKLSSALNNADELVAGSRPTASEAVSGLTEGTPLQAHQAIISQEPAKGISAMFGKRIADQRAAREAQLAFAGTEDDIIKLVNERTAAVKPLYEAVKTSTAKVKSSPVLTMVNNILNENPNRTAIASPLKQIRDKLILRTENGVKIENRPQALKSLSDEISDMMGKKTVNGTNEYDVKVLAQIKETLDQKLGESVPEFAEAQRLFAEKSAPINVMKIGQALKDKLTNPTGVETPGTYLRALDNEKKLLKDSIGFGRTGVEKILSPEQMKSVENVAADLERSVAAKSPLQKTNLRGGVNVANETTVSLPQMLSRPAMITNSVLKALGRNVEPEVDAYFARLYLNPKELGAVLSKIAAPQRSAFNQMVQERGRIAAISASANISKRTDE